MPRGDKSAYTDRQKRKAEHIEDGYKAQGLSTDEAERRAWATVNKQEGGGKLSGSGRGKAIKKPPGKKTAASKRAPAKKVARKSATKKSTRKSVAKKSSRKS